MVQVRQFARFVAVGVVNTVFGYAVFAMLVWVGLGVSLALLIATIIGVLFNFVTTGRLVFANRNFRLIGRFVAAYVVIYLVNLGLLDFLRRWNIGAISAQAFCLLAIVPSSFIFQKFFVFRELSDERN